MIVMWTTIFDFLSSLLRLIDVCALHLFGSVIHVMIRGAMDGVRVVLRANLSLTVTLCKRSFSPSTWQDPRVKGAKDRRQQQQIYT